jgi:hypothetical protein
LGLVALLVFKSDLAVFRKSETTFEESHNRLISQGKAAYREIYQVRLILRDFDAR